jgi:peptide/nickel transport system permease protein
VSAAAVFWNRYRRNRAAVGGLALLVTIVLLALVGPQIYPVDPFDMVGRPFSPPFGEFPLGTDVSGRDILAGVVRGAGVSLMIGCVAALTSTAIGVAFGAFAGYYGGWIDDLLMRITEYFLTIPSFMFAVVLVAIFSPSVFTVTIAIAVVSWPSVARLVRGEFLVQRDLEYVQACRSMGMRDVEIILAQILPNTMPAVIVIGSLTVATAILTESGISFLGLSDPNYVTWGYMVGVARTALLTAPWMIAMPGVAILVTVLAINLVGEGLNDALNPKLRSR